NAMPALTTPPTDAAVSSAPQSLPLAKVTCCMRVSFVSRRAALKLRTAPEPMMRPQRVRVGVPVSAMQSRSGRLPAFWSAFGTGPPYCSTATVLVLRTRSGLALSIDRVFDTVQTTRSLEVKVLLKTASALSKNSVPWPEFSNSPLPGDCAAQTVCPTTAESFVSPVLKRTAETFAERETSARLETA